MSGVLTGASEDEVAQRTAAVVHRELGHLVRDEWVAERPRLWPPYVTPPWARTQEHDRWVLVRSVRRDPHAALASTVDWSAVMVWVGVEGSVTLKVAFQPWSYASLPDPGSVDRLRAALGPLAWLLDPPTEEAK